MANSHPYILGYSSDETRRLRLQADLFNPSTRHSLSTAGIGPGMKVLDIGSGAAMSPSCSPISSARWGRSSGSNRIRG